jgi:6-phosphogluconate dehydrogenase
MAHAISRFGIIGLGKMGAALAQNARQSGFDIVGVDRKGVPEELARSGVSAAKVSELVALPPPRFVMLYVPAGPLVDQLLDQLAGCLASGDIVADGGNSYWGDSIRRHARMKGKLRTR